MLARLSRRCLQQSIAVQLPASLAAWRLYRPGQESSLPDELSNRLVKAFERAPDDTCKSIVEALDPKQRFLLAKCIIETGVPESFKKEGLNLDETYVARILETADTHAPKGLLDRQELRTALDLDRALNAAASGKPVEAQPLTAGGLGLMALSAGIPFIGFGFMDNAIMLVAGEEIDVMFGSAWGLSKLAAAGLGNIVADVVGVGCAEQIEDWVRRIKWIAPPKLTKEQRSQFVAKAARMGGAMLGVSVGGLIGLVPLLWLDAK